MVYSFALFWALGWLGLYFYAPRHSAFREAASPWNFIVPMVGFPVGVALGTCLTLLSVIIGRRSLAAAEEQPSEGRISNGIVIGLTGVGLLFLSAMVWYAHSHRLSFPFALFLNGLFGVFICSAVVLTGCLLVAVTIACLMFIDRMFWPLMSRLLYRLPRHRFVENKRVLAGIATVLVVFAITGNYDWHILQKLMLGW
jgi:hypothetical protein